MGIMSNATSRNQQVVFAGWPNIFSVSSTLMCTVDTLVDLAGKVDDNDYGRGMARGFELAAQWLSEDLAIDGCSRLAR